MTIAMTLLYAYAMMAFFMAGVAIGDMPEKLRTTSKLVEPIFIGAFWPIVILFHIIAILKK